MKDLLQKQKPNKKLQQLKNYLLKDKQKIYWKCNKQQSNKEQPKKKNKKMKGNNKLLILNNYNMNKNQLN